jgi:hypothetical protein
VACCEALLEGGRLFGIPAVVVMQYVKGLGPMPPELEAACAAAGVTPLEKMSFSACRDGVCQEHVRATGRDQVVVAGIEAHVCVQQSVLDLLAERATPFVCADAVSSRSPEDKAVALERMRQAGAVIATTEAVLFEWCGFSGTDEFRQLRDLLKRFDAARRRARGGQA